MPTETRPVEIPAADYHAMEGLSNSGMCDLAVSPFRYWHLHVNPERPADEPTPAMILGSALHCAALEPSKFDSRYAREVDASDFPDCLVTIEDLRLFLRNSGVTPKGTRKTEIIEQVQAVSMDVPILEVLERRHYAENEGKTFLSRDHWLQVEGMAESLLAEPRLQDILRQGEAEVSMFAKDPDTGVLLKSRQDWVNPKLTLDLKTFTQKRGKSIDKSVADAIFYENYLRQAYLYSMIRRLQTESTVGESGEFVIAFVESDPPHEVRIKALRPKTGGNVNIYWERARIECRGLIRLYSECVERFGEKPWRDAREIDPLQDEELPGLAY